MTGTQLAATIRRYTKTNSTTLADADLLVDVNNVKDDLANLIVQKNENLFMMTSTDALVASSVTAREYALPDDVLNHILTVEGAFDTTQATVFTPILPYSGGLQRLIRELDGITEAKITNYFSNQKPRYFKTRRGIYILSGTISALSAGLKIRYTAFSADLANLTGTTGLEVDPTTTTFGMLRQLHELWARRVSIIWKSSRPKPIPLSALELIYEKDLEKALNGIAMDDYGEEVFGSLPSEDSPSVLGAESTQSGGGWI